MKKGIIAIILLLAVVILISPGIIGKLAERRVDATLESAVDHSRELVVTMDGFQSGWFSSAGEHRVAIGEGQLRSALTASGTASDELPVLVISTRMDHGLIPVTSMSREKGSLTPGLGSAVSTMRIEHGDGERIELPGTIYSKVTLGGNLESQYLLEAGSQAVDKGTLSWEPGSVDLTADTDGSYVFDGKLDGVSMRDGGDDMTLGPLRFTGSQVPTPYGFFTGDIDATLDSIRIASAGGPGFGIGPMSIKGQTALDDDRVASTATMSLEKMSVPMFGDAALHMEMALEGDAAAFGRLMELIENAEDPAGITGAASEAGADLLAAGLTFDLPRLDITLPMGKVESVIAFSVPASDRASFEFSSLLLKSKAAVDLSIPATLVDMAMAMDEQAAMLIGMGILVRDGDVYVMDADMEKGLLTVNGAPIPLPAGLF